jgi:hypothetical protein
MPPYQEGYKLGYLEGKLVLSLCLFKRLRDTFALTNT